MARAFCGRSLCSLNLLAVALLVAGCPGAPEPVDGGPRADGGSDAPPSRCVGDDECSDGNFCNGLERCDAAAVGADERGCAPSRGRPCLDAQVCEEATDTCVTDCGADRDADDDGVDAANCPGGTDCDDADPLRHPGLLEVCDAEDHDEDCDDATFGERDLDRDGAFDARCCNEDGTGVRRCGDDCDDARRGVRPLGAEVCDGLDNDCSGTFDEGVTVLAFVDGDRDLHGETGATAMACPGASGVSSVDDDCDGASRARHGSQVEICDELDNDCDGRVDENARPVTWYGDADGDGFGAAASGTVVSCAPQGGYSLVATDCDDGNRSRSPLGVEVCNGLDDDCNGLADFAIGVNDFEDDDGDGHADAACGGDDCDDGDWTAYLGAPEICDWRDSDCDGLADAGASPPPGVVADDTMEIDWFVDLDTDLWGATAGAIRSCEPQLGRVARGGDCDDDDATTHPGAADLCDGFDDDCDASLDEDSPELAFYADADDDGSGAGAATLACSAPPGMTDLPGDCAPADAATGPGAAERCNAADDDCDLAVDEALFFDEDGDGHGDPARPVVGACAPGSAVIGTSDDCDDGATSRSPALLEACNGIDDDCDLSIDDGADAACSAGGVPGTCAAGRCALGCAAGRGDCDGDPATGCETDLTTDARNCGVCGEVCGVAGACAAGACDRVVEVVTGPNRTCARRSGGGVLCWGGIYDASAVSPFPVAIAGITTAVSISISQNANCAALVTGEVLCWGYNGDGELGRSPTSAGFDPVPRPVPGVTDAVEVEGNRRISCARRRTPTGAMGGGLVCWGGRSGGHGTPTDDVVAEVIPGVSDVVSLTSLGQVAGGNPTGIYILTADGSVLVVGDSAGLSIDGVTDLSVRFPGPVLDIGVSWGSGWPDVAACALLASGDVVCTGSNDNGLFGDMLASPAAGSYRAAHPAWTPATGVREIVTTGGNHDVTCARFADGTVRCSGSCNEFYAASRGDGCGSTRAVDTMVSGLADVVDLSAASAHVCAVEGDGDVYCWGSAQFGRLGHGLVAGVENLPVRAVTD